MNRKISGPTAQKRFFFLYPELDRLLTLFMLFSSVLLLARIAYTGRFTFVFLEWNLFLAYLPHFISSFMSRRASWVNHKLWFILLFAVWLIFIPNSFYILTDLFHLRDHYNDLGVPQWFDLALILSFAWNGLMLGLLSVREMEKLLAPQWAVRHELQFIYPVMWLNALGIYIGRYLRLNSWDLLTNPFRLLGDMANILFHPVTNRVAWAMIFCYSILMTLMFLTLKKISRSLR